VFRRRHNQKAKRVSPDCLLISNLCIYHSLLTILLDLQDKIEKARTTIESCEKRMEGYKIELSERTKLEATENSLALNLKTWCKMVKREVLSPMTKEEAELSRPRSNNHTSAPIEKVKSLAGTLGIVDIPVSRLVCSLR
jgi:hypothetical protein